MRVVLLVQPGAASDDDASQPFVGTYNSDNGLVDAKLCGAGGGVFRQQRIQVRAERTDRHFAAGFTRRGSQQHSGGEVGCQSSQATDQVPAA